MYSPLSNRYNSAHATRHSRPSPVSSMCASVARRGGATYARLQAGLAAPCFLKIYCIQVSTQPSLNANECYSHVLQNTLVQLKYPRLYPCSLSSAPIVQGTSTCPFVDMPPSPPLWINEHVRRCMLMQAIQSLCSPHALQLLEVHKSQIAFDAPKPRQAAATRTLSTPVQLQGKHNGSSCDLERRVVDIEHVLPVLHSTPIDSATSNS